MTKVKHFKKDCISCGACVAVCSNYFEMDSEGFAQLKGSREVDDHWELSITTKEAKATIKEAVGVCPVQIIKMVE